MIEVVLSVVLLSIFTVAAGVVIAQGSTTSSDSRARVVAAGLAQRELDIVAETIAASPEGANDLLDPSTVSNPNLTSELSSGNAEWAFKVSGQRFKLVRQAQAQTVGLGSPCDSTASGGGSITRLATLVTVTVTWEGMGNSNRPHVASRLYPPNPKAEVGLGTDKAAIGVRVTGMANPETSDRAGIRVQVTGPGYTGSAITDARGCALFVVKPPVGGYGDYDVQLLGSTGGGHFVNLIGEERPTQTVLTVSAGQSRNITFVNYDDGGGLTVTVVNAGPTDTEVVLLPAMGGAGSERTAPIVDGKAVFSGLNPGQYSASVGATSISVTITAGSSTQAQLVIP
jgi:hypothetical protein